MPENVKHPTQSTAKTMHRAKNKRSVNFIFHLTERLEQRERQGPGWRAKQAGALGSRVDITWSRLPAEVEFSHALASILSAVRSSRTESKHSRRLLLVQASCEL